MAIQSFRCSRTARFFAGERVKVFERFEDVAMRKLAMLDAALGLPDLLIPPANRLEALRGNRDGQHSIRINGQYRLCFTWTPSGPAQVEICDYH